MMSLRLLHVIRSVDPAVGGPVEGIRQLASAYKSMGISAEVVSLDDPDSKHAQDFSLPVHLLGPTHLGRYSYSSRLGPWLSHNHEKYDCVIVNGLWQYHSYAVRHALRKTGRPYVVFTHGMLDPWFKHEYPLKHLKKWLYWPWGEYRVLRDAAAVLFTSREEMLLARESFWLYKVKPVVIGYGTRGPNVDLQAASHAFLEEFPHLRDKKVAISLGRLHPKKGCDLLIEAFARTLAPDPAWHLIMAGPDQVGWQEQLISQAERLNIAGRVTWTGMLSGARKWGALGCSEIFVLPSHQENFGIVVAEALACGVPVLISNKVNIWREVQTEEAGLVENDTLEGIEALFTKWLNFTPQQRQTMKNRTRDAFLRHFDIDTNSKTIVAVAQRVAKLNSDSFAVRNTITR